MTTSVATAMTCGRISLLQGVELWSTQFSLLRGENVPGLTREGMGRAVEHAIFSASLLGLYFAFGAAYDSYEIGWLGLTGALALLFTTLPHLRIVIGITKIRESRLNIGHSESPLGGPEKLIITAQETKADALERKSEAIGKMYVSARMYWLIGVTAGAALGVLEWFL